MAALIVLTPLPLGLVAGVGCDGSYDNDWICSSAHAWSIAVLLLMVAAGGGLLGVVVGLITRAGVVVWTTAAASWTVGLAIFIFELHKVSP